ncbi:mediator of RNA polymerase II transcription subunit 22-like [Tubulanus polymorphus]|uniref:mediator of RNA polymerase II transcription subunit 22-like n=1 Tax=Tubulanus polymorphus TaxID=672921 RepID=UPI003DA4DBCA
MSGQRSLPQSREALLKSYHKRLKDDTKAMVDNFTEILKLSKIDDDPQISRTNQIEQDNYEMQVRAANMVRAGESLMKLVSDLKQFLILNDFVSINEAILQNTRLFKHMQNECDSKLMTLRDDIASDLFEMEEEYYSSVYK